MKNKKKKKSSGVGSVLTHLMTFTIGYLIADYVEKRIAISESIRENEDGKTVLKKRGAGTLQVMNSKSKMTTHAEKPQAKPTTVPKRIPNKQYIVAVDSPKKCKNRNYAHL